MDGVDCGGLVRFVRQFYGIRSSGIQHIFRVKTDSALWINIRMVDLILKLIYNKKLLRGGNRKGNVVF